VFKSRWSAAARADSDGTSTGYLRCWRWRRALRVEEESLWQRDSLWSRL